MRLSTRIRQILYALAAFMVAATLLETLAFLANEYWALPLTSEALPDYRRLAVRNAHAAGKHADTRLLGEVIESARHKGEHSFPLLSVAYYLDAPHGSKIFLDGEPILPLSLEPSGVGYYCNESGEYVPFRMDRFGFRNPDSVWGKQSPSLLITGDSIAMGSCLFEEDSFVGRLRPQHPDILNLAIGANGPLMELATLREYLPAIKPRKVLWVYFENDLEDMVRDTANPILRRYLNDPGFSQQLIQKRSRLAPEIAQLSQEYLTAVLAAESAARHAPASDWSAKRSFAVRRIKFWWNSMMTPAPTEVPAADFIKLMVQARDFVASQGSQFIVVYVPDCDKTAAKPAANAILSGLSSLGIDVIDTRPAIEKITHSGLKAFTFCPGGHLTPDASREIAGAISGKLEKS